MAGFTRRDLLKAGAGAGVLALGTNPWSSRRWRRKNCRPGELTDIEHVVILIQENRSFDHYFGTLPGVRGFYDTSVPRSIFEQPGYPQEGYGGVLLPFHPETGPRRRASVAFPTSPTRGCPSTKAGTTARWTGSCERTSPPTDPKPGPRRWATTSARTSPTTTHLPKRSPSATTITAR